MPGKLEERQIPTKTWGRKSEWTATRGGPSLVKAQKLIAAGWSDD